MNSNVTLSWSPNSQSYVEPVTGTTVHLAKQSWVYFAVERCGGIAKVLSVLQLRREQLVEWVQAGEVPDRDFARLLSQMSGVPQYRLRSQAGGQA